MTITLPPLVADTAMSTVAYLADISDPTDDGMLMSLVNWGLAVLMVVVVLLGGWYAFKAWMDKKGKVEAVTEVRNVAFGVLAIEAFLGAVLFLANYGTTIISNFS
jgi:hypothetical protein